MTSYRQQPPRGSIIRKSTRIVGISAAILIFGIGTAAAFVVSNDTGAASEPINNAAPVESVAAVPRPAEAAIPLVKPTPTGVDPGNWEVILHDGLFANYSGLSDQTQVDMCDSLRSLGTGRKLADYILSANDGSTSAALASLYVTPADLAGIPTGVPPQQVLEFAGDAVLEFCRS